MTVDPRTPPQRTSRLADSARHPLSMGGAKTIGVLADYMNASGSAYEAHIRDAIDARCRERGHNLIVVYGRALEDPAPASVPHNAIFNRLTPEIVDGILLISSCLAALSGVEGLQRLAGRCQPLPLCSIGIEAPGVPSVVADNAPGMARVLEHLIVEHGCRKIAFIAGIADNPEAKIRFEVKRSREAWPGCPSRTPPTPWHVPFRRRSMVAASIAELLERIVLRQAIRVCAARGHWCRRDSLCRGGWRVHPRSSFRPG